VETLTGRDLVGLGYGSIGLVHRASREQAWFSNWHQIQTLFDRLAVDLVIDVGAHHGSFGRSIRPFYAGPILSFEPVSTAFAVLASAAAADPDWHAFPIALGEADAELSIHVPIQGDFSSLLPSNSYGAARFVAGSVPSRDEQVKVRRLDDVLAETTAVAAAQRIFLKIDTQGYDSKVFAGLGDRVEDIVALQSEVSLIPVYEGMPHWTESLATYEAAGFGVVGMYPVTHDGARVIEYDCLMQRVPGSAPRKGALPSE
jgi:FkbM family methyltransferase